MVDQKNINDVLYKEIDLIQACISRMAKNSFSCKGWNLTLIAGTFALVPQNINRWYICIIMMCIDACFWWLDSFFLLQEQKYRDKYEWVIKKRLEGNEEFLYDLNPQNEKMNLENKKRKLWKTAFSTTLFPMYGGIVLLMFVFIVIKLMASQ